MGGRAPTGPVPGRAPPLLAWTLAALAVAQAAGAVQAALPYLVVTTAAGGVLAEAPRPADGRGRLGGRRSVAQATVIDVFEYRDGVMLVVEQVTPHPGIAGLGGFA